MNKMVQMLLADRLARRRVHELEDRRGFPMARQAIFGWARLKDGVPLDRVPSVAQALGVPAYEIRPDKPHLFPPPRGKSGKRKKSNGQ
jgi:hypothetical protein